eukprot:TRINITY_DN2870_c0_g2_i1.p1 TRINITY_DN2870_c0_g2~~TRINITY_DN2870_c0_g2_i1.p1  ORF type:complete len:1803 (+),score=387.95 TRINITY_DN2870_c0_g2_i1:475-5883(+)
MTVPCYIFGQQKTGSGTLFAFSQSSGTSIPNASATSNVGNPYPPTYKLATDSNLGPVWGLAWNRYSKTMFMSSFVKRYSNQYQNNDYNTGLIWYQSHRSNAPPSILVNVSANYTTCIGDVHQEDIALGSCTSRSCDKQAWDKVGTCGLGGISLNRNATILYVMNLFSRSIIMYFFDSPISLSYSTFKSVPVPLSVPGCISDDVRPFAVKHHDNAVYIGSVCSGQSNNSITNLRAYVFKAPEDLSSFTLVLDVYLGYARGTTSSTGTNPFCVSSGKNHIPSPSNAATWRPWASAITENPLAYSQCFYPQPIVSDIVFGDQGQLIVSIMDRYGHQSGNNYGGSDNNNPLEGVSAGDVICAYPVGDGTYNIESNGNCGPLSGGYTYASGSRLGVSNSQGPGYGEFFYDDYYDTVHSETSVGGLTLFPGQGEVWTTTFNPYPEQVPIIVNGTSQNSYRTGGVRRFVTDDGKLNRSFLIYYIDQPGTFGNAAGLGDIELSCGLPPVQIGNRVWNDVNRNGIQDFGEEGIDNVNVTLYTLTGSYVSSMLTANGGLYNFSSRKIPSLFPGSSFVIAVNRNTVSIGGLPANNRVYPASPSGRGTRSLDSDSTNINNVNVNTTVFIGSNMYDFGNNDHTYDFGFYNYSEIGGRIWCDIDSDGIQDPDEPGIYNVDVQLYSGATFIASTMTNITGYYLFTNLNAAVNYTVRVGLTGPLTAASSFISPANQGTDPNKNSNYGATIAGTYFTLIPDSGVSTVDHHVDGGIRLGNIGDKVWLDTGSTSSQQDGADAYFPDVILELYDVSLGSVVATTTTDASGAYIFNCASFNTDYQVRIPLNQSSLKGRAPVAPGNGTSNADSNGLMNEDMSYVYSTNVTVTASTVTNDTIDFGFSDAATLSGIIFCDQNLDGVFNVNEPLIPFSVVNLIFAYTTPPFASFTVKTVADANGFYRFDHVPVASDLQITMLQSTNPTLNVDNTTVPGTPSGYTRIANITNQTSMSFGFRGDSIGDYVWNDVNRNGIQDASDTPIGGVVVELRNNNVVISTVTTDTRGLYSFACLQDGIYTVSIQYTSSSNAIALSNFVPTGYYLGTGNATDSDGVPTTINNVPVVQSQPIVVSGGTTVSNIDFGFRKLLTVTGYIFCDTTNNRQRDSSERGFSGVTVTLSNILTTNNILTSIDTTTDASGFYNFTNVNVDGSKVVITAPTAIDGRSATTVTTRQISSVDTTNVDFGYIGYTIGKFVWSDYNRDGIQSAGEPGFPGITLSLRNSTTNTIIDTTTTDDIGYYYFTCVSNGVYAIEITQSGLLANALISPVRAGNSSSDSDAFGTTTFFANVTVTNASIYDVDFGFIFPNISIGDVVWNDFVTTQPSFQNNGVQDTTEFGAPPIDAEAGINAVVLGLFLDGVLQQTTTTTASGVYQFHKILPFTTGYEVRVNSFATTTYRTATLPFINPFNNASDSNAVSYWTGGGSATAPTNIAFTIPMTGNTNDFTYDIGFVPTSNAVPVGYQVFCDTETTDGILGTNEVMPTDNFTINYFSTIGSLVASTTVGAISVSGGTRSNHVTYLPTATSYYVVIDMTTGGSNYNKIATTCGCTTGMNRVVFSGNSSIWNINTSTITRNFFVGTAAVTDMNLGFRCTIPMTTPTPTPTPTPAPTSTPEPVVIFTIIYSSKSQNFSTLNLLQDFQSTITVPPDYELVLISDTQESTTTTTTADTTTGSSISSKGTLVIGLVRKKSSSQPITTSSVLGSPVDTFLKELNQKQSEIDNVLEKNFGKGNVVQWKSDVPGVISSSTILLPALLSLLFSLLISLTFVY